MCVPFYFMHIVRHDTKKNPDKYNTSNNLTQLLKKTVLWTFPYQAYTDFSYLFTKCCHTNLWISGSSTCTINTWLVPCIKIHIYSYFCIDNQKHINRIQTMRSFEKVHTMYMGLKDMDARTWIQLFTNSSCEQSRALKFKKENFPKPIPHRTSWYQRICKLICSSGKGAKSIRKSSG